MDKVEFIGHLGRDPEMRYTESGTPVANFSVGVNRSFTGADGAKHRRTIWYRVSVWGAQAEACNTYLQKGRQVYVEGQMTGDLVEGKSGEQIIPRVWQGRDGSYRASWEVRARTVQFLGSRSSSPVGEETSEEEEIPFD